MTRVRLVHWHDSEAGERIAALKAAGYEVEHEPLRDQAAMRRIAESAPEAIVIDLSRLPSQGRDLALWLRRQKATRQVPLVLIGGAAEKVERIKRLLPDAVYSDWSRFGSAVERAVGDPPKDPVVSSSALAGYSGTPLPKKLGIKLGAVVALISAPEGFSETLGPLPEGALLRPSGRGRRDLTVCFVRSRGELERRIDRLVNAARQGGVWIAWPKKASGVATDLSQAYVRRSGLASGLVDYRICAIDATWSGLLFARRKK